MPTSEPFIFSSLCVPLSTPHPSTCKTRHHAWWPGRYTCFYCMKKGHSVRFCKIRKYCVPKGLMKWIPKGCDVSNSKEKPKGPKFVRDQILQLEFVYAGKMKRKRRTESSDQAVEEKWSHWSWINAMQKVKTVKRSFLDQQAIGSLKKQHKDKTFLLFVLNFCFKVLSYD